DFEAIGALNVEAYREFAGHMSPEGWRGMEASLRAVEARAQSAQFLVMRSKGQSQARSDIARRAEGTQRFFHNIGQPSFSWRFLQLIAVGASPGNWQPLAFSVHVPTERRSSVSSPANS